MTYNTLKCKNILTNVAYCYTLFIKLLNICIGAAGLPVARTVSLNDQKTKTISGVNDYRGSRRLSACQKKNHI